MLGTYSMSLLLAFTLAVQTAPAQTPADSETKPFFMRSFEHALPSILEYREAGLYGSRNTPYAVALHFREGQWDVQLERNGRIILKARLDKAYNRIPVNRIVVSSVDNDQRFVVTIPFGEPHSECFENGDDVYSQLAIQSIGEINLQHFPKCSFEEAPLKVRRANGVLLVGGPPQVTTPLKSSN